MGPNKMRARFLTSFGRHQPRCHGRCLVADVESENNAVWVSTLLIVVPTILFVFLVPFGSYWVAVLTSVVLLVLSLTYLLLAMYTEPGILPIEQPDSGRRRVTHVVVDGERKELAHFRAKMCRQTENCVAEFDHYCPWVGNAIGRRNYRYFIAFVVTVSFLALVVGVSAGLRFADVRLATSAKAGTDFPWSDVFLICLVVYTAVVLISVCGLVCFHLRLIAVNQTTNENIRGAYYSTPNPHDRGAFRNFAAFFLRPVPQSRVASYVHRGRTLDATRIPTTDDDEDCHNGLVDEDDDQGREMEMI